MKYYKIEIIENTDIETKRKFFIVSDKTLTELENWSTYGEFLRFEINVYTETEVRKDVTNKKELEVFIHSILGLSKRISKYNFFNSIGSNA